MTEKSMVFEQVSKSSRGDLYFVFEQRVVFPSGKLTGRKVGNYVDEKMLWR